MTRNQQKQISAVQLPFIFNRQAPQLLSNMSNRSFISILVTLLVAAAAAELKVEVYDGPKGMKVLFTYLVFVIFFLHNY